MLGDALLNPRGYALLEAMVTRYGHRLTGTEGNARSMDHLEQALHDLGVQTRREPFAVPGWVRGDDRAYQVAPRRRELRAAAMGYVDRQDPVEAGLAFVDTADFDTLDAEALRGRIVLIRHNVRMNREKYQRLAEDFGAVGALLMNRVAGGQLLARTANHDGVPPPFPVFSITQEDGIRLQDQLEAGLDVRVRLEARSEVREMTGINLVAVLPGRSAQKVVVGGHFDSWDLGQGAMDNGVGVAQLFETARLLKKHSPFNTFTVELVFFDAEEWGLWGSRRYMERHDPEGIRVMLNLDMVGDIQGVNAMGFDELVPVLEAYRENLGGLKLERKVSNEPWLGSDHHPFMLQGIPAITFYAPIPREDVRYYHDYADTLDKVDPELLAVSSAKTALLTYRLANLGETDLRRYRPGEMAELYKKAGLDARLKESGQWPFGEDDSGAE